MNVAASNPSKSVHLVKDLLERRQYISYYSCGHFYTHFVLAIFSSEN